MKITFLTFLVLFAITIQAQQLDLSYEEAVKIALEQNVSLRKQQNELKISKAERDQSRAEVAPNISASATGLRAKGNYFLEQEARIINTTSNNLSAGLNANMNVFSGLYQMNAIKLYNASYQSQEHLIERTAQEVIFMVSNQYLSALLSTELLEIAEDNLKTQELLYTQIEAMVEAGSKPKSDLYDQMAIVKERELLVLRQKNELRNNKMDLAITLQQDPTVELSVNTPDWDLEEMRFYQLDVNELYQLSMARRPDIKQFEATEIVAQKSVSMAKSAFAPSLGAFYGFSTRYNDQSVRDLVDQFKTDNKRSTYGLSLSIPIFSGLRNRTQFVRQKVFKENSEINTENLKITILNDVRNAYQNFLDVRSAYEVSIARMDAANMALQIQQEKYNLGVGSLIELTNANNNQISAAAGNAQARLNLLFQKVVLDYHTGVLQTP